MYIWRVRVPTINLQKYSLIYAQISLTFFGILQEALPEAWNDNCNIFQMKIMTLFNFMTICILKKVPELSLTFWRNKKGSLITFFQSFPLLSRSVGTLRATHAGLEYIWTYIIFPSVAYPSCSVAYSPSSVAYPLPPVCVAHSSGAYPPVLLTAVLPALSHQCCQPCCYLPSPSSVVYSSVAYPLPPVFTEVLPTLSLQQCCLPSPWSVAYPLPPVLPTLSLKCCLSSPEVVPTLSLKCYLPSPCSNAYPLPEVLQRFP